MTSREADALSNQGDIVQGLYAALTILGTPGLDAEDVRVTALLLSRVACNVHQDLSGLTEHGIQ